MVKTRSSSIKKKKSASKSGSRPTGEKKVTKVAAKSKSIKIRRKKTIKATRWKADQAKAIKFVEKITNIDHTPLNEKRTAVDSEPFMWKGSPQNIFTTNRRPWANVHELADVQHAIYTTIVYEPAEGGSSRVARMAPSLADRLDRLNYARDRVITWRRRAKNMDESPVADNNLATIETLLDIVLLEESSGDQSALYRLYSMAVIDFCKCLESYRPKDGFASIERQAETMGTPTWIVNIRHRLCHSGQPPVSVSELEQAVYFIFRWLELHFFATLVEAEVRPHVNRSLEAEKMELLRELSFYPSDLLLLAPPLSTLAETPLVTNDICNSAIIDYILNCHRKEFIDTGLVDFANVQPNAYISNLVNVLVFDLGNRLKPSLNDVLEPSSRRYLVGIEKAIGVLFGLRRYPAGRMVLTLLNGLIDDLGIVSRQLVKNVTALNTINSARRKALFALTWIVAIIKAITSEMKSTKKRATTKANETTSFAGTFRVSALAFETLKTDYEFDWLKTFYALLKALPVGQFVEIGGAQLAAVVVDTLERFYRFIDGLMTPGEFQVMCQIVKVAGSGGEADKVEVGY